MHLHLETKMNGNKMPPGQSALDEDEDGNGAIVHLAPRIQEAIGKALRAYTSDIVSAPIPDKFVALLAKLEASERGRQ